MLKGSLDNQIKGFKLFTVADIVSTRFSYCSKRFEKFLEQVLKFQF